MPRPGPSISPGRQQVATDVFEQMQGRLLALKQQQDMLMESFTVLLDEMHAKTMPSNSSEPPGKQIEDVRDIKGSETAAIGFSEPIQVKAHGEEYRGEQTADGEIVPLSVLVEEEAIEKDRRRMNSMDGEPDEPVDSKTHPWKKQLSDIVKHRRFDYLTGFVILLNSAFIGFETQYSIEEEGLYIPPWTGFIFLTIYILEIAVRLIVFGRECFRSLWFIFDFFLVGMSLVTDVFFPIFYVQGAIVGLIEQIMVLRMFRLFRLVRALRMMKFMRTAWTLIHGLLTSGSAMTSTLGLLVLFLYIFACAGVELITKDEELATHPDTAWIVEYHFGTLQRIMLTLFGFVCADSVSAIYTPLILARPILSIYFLLLLIGISVALMNLVTAVIVEGALEQASQDKELLHHDYHESVKEAIPKLMQIFQQHDADGNGQLTLCEVKTVPIEAIIPGELMTDAVSSMEEVFEALDVSGDGNLSQSEFVDGLMDIFAKDVPLQTVQMLRMLRNNKDNMALLSEKVDSLLTRSSSSS